VDLRRSKFILIAYIFIMPFTSYAGDFDGSKLLSGSVEKVLEISQFRVSDDVDPEIVGLPRKFFIDIEEKTMLPSVESMVRRISRIKHVEHIENKIILQGVEEGVENVDDGLGWRVPEQSQAKNLPYFLATLPLYRSMSVFFKSH